MGFTETERLQNAPLADRHSSAPAAERCTTWLCTGIRHPAGAIRGVHRDGRRGRENSPLADRHSSAPAAERCTTSLFAVRHPAGTIRGVHRDGTARRTAAGRPPQLRPGRGRCTTWQCRPCPPPSRSHPWGSPRRNPVRELLEAPRADRHNSAPAAERCTTRPL